MKQRFVTLLVVVLQALLLLQVHSQSTSGVSLQVYNLKYRVSLDAWLIDYEISSDGYETCVKLENSCCYLQNQIISAQKVTIPGNRLAVQFAGQAEGSSCPSNSQLIIQVIGYTADSDLYYRYGRYNYRTNIGQSDGSLVEGAKNQFLLSIDDQMNYYMFKLPSLASSYTDNDSYNYALVYLASSSDSMYLSKSIGVLLVLLLLQ